MTIPWFAQMLASSGFLARYPAYAELVAQMEPMATDQVEWMAIARHLRADGRNVLRLYVNRDTLLQEPQHFAGILLHEIHHVVCGHLDDGALHQVEHANLMELAMETAANENILEPTPPGIEWQDFAEFGCEPGQSTRQRYDKLVAAQADGRLRVLTEAQLDATRPGWRKQLKQTSGNRGMRVLIQPTKKSLLPWHNQPRVLDKAMHDEHRPGAVTRGDGRGVGDAIDRRSDGSRQSTWENHGWGLGRPTQQEQLHEWQLQIRAFVRGDGSGPGDINNQRRNAAKEIPRRVANTERSGMLAWPAILHHLLPSHRRIHPTYLRPNRRFPARVGELPGRTRRLARPRLLVGIDTSASMSAESFASIRMELIPLQQFADCTIAECDVAVHRVHHQADIEIVTGGGDTDFHPLFELLEGHRRFDAAIYFTDGVGQWPLTAPAVPVLWALTNNRAFDCPWGQVVRIADALQPQAV